MMGMTIAIAQGHGRKSTGGRAESFVRERLSDVTAESSSSLLAAEYHASEIAAERGTQSACPPPPRGEGIRSCLFILPDTFTILPIYQLKNNYQSLEPKLEIWNGTSKKRKTPLMPIGACLATTMRLPLTPSGMATAAQTSNARNANCKVAG